MENLVKYLIYRYVMESTESIPKTDEEYEKLKIKIVNSQGYINFCEWIKK